MKRSQAAIGVAACLVAATAGFLTGRLAVGTPEAARSENVPPVTAKVVQGQVTQTVDVPLAMTSAWTTTVTSPAQGPRHVATRVDASEGQPVRVCTSPVAVNDVPIVLMNGSTPLFRDMSVGNRGTDVAGLQAGLKACGLQVSDPAGTLGRSTLDAWNKLARSGANPAEVVGWRQVVMLPAGITQATVAQVPSAGATVGANEPLISLSAGTQIAVGGTSPSTATALRKGQTVPVTLTSGKEVQGTIHAISAPQAAPDPNAGDAAEPAADGRQDPATVPPGQSRLEITLPSPSTDDAPISATIVVADSPASSLAVPLAALTSCGAAACVHVLDGDISREVTVRTGLSSSRLVVVSPIDGQLTVGDAVVVEGP
ncbi:hypothetical protein KILIM_097_00050 [Kineosphaera limosa NBRC 100340]|uniref:Peptidoglycan binding-like domain-containing protein n=2 Tax=Kineosphaera TaxID=211469 RepID=K6WW43_9MICO|nr:hypothetical protein KILIM_097_00050 [Kineosphaera limosa NBRC 100340]